MPFYLPSGQTVFQPAFLAAPPQPQPAHQNKDPSNATGHALALPQGKLVKTNVTEYASALPQGKNLEVVIRPLDSSFLPRSKILSCNAANRKSKAPPVAL